MAGCTLPDGGFKGADGPGRAGVGGGDGERLCGRGTRPPRDFKRATTVSLGGLGCSAIVEGK